ncbi:MAG: YsnF/AvaK domain-containing protein [Actinomycetota bacterium]|nr:YsnF/AvaK domain-containing protein [Actinomycetota bacterium]
MDRDDKNRGIREGDVEGGEFREHGHDQEGLSQREGSDLNDRDEIRVERQEEELRAGVREREAGQVNVRKTVHTEREQIAVPKRREEVSVDRVPVNDGTPGEIGEDEVSVPVVEEEVVVEKRPVIKEEVRIRKDVVQEEEIVEEDVRKEEIDIDDASGTGGRRS